MNLHLCKKVLDAEQIRQADQFTIKNEPISSIDLMERASEAFYEKFISLYDIARPVYIFCGVGNNGGDGLVVARLLLEQEYTVRVFAVGNEAKGTADFKLNKKILEAYTEIRWLKGKSDFPQVTKDMVIIDAIFGSGLDRKIQGIFGELIDHINHATCRDVVAIDIASGLGCNTNFEEGQVLNVKHTITFQVPKLSLMLPQNMEQSGDVHVVDIGLNEDFISSLTTNQFLVTKAFIRNMLKGRGKFLHKGDFGKDLIIGGSRGKMGAAILASHACLRSGAGLLTSFVPSHGSPLMTSCLPESMVLESEHNDVIKGQPEKLADYDAIGVGPGIGQAEDTKETLRQLFASVDLPLVVDADALNMLAGDDQLQRDLPDESILTPHPGEFRRLVGDWQDDYHRLELQIELSKKLRCVVLLKGAHTSITTPRGLVFFNPTGNPGMATAGSGDVLTGIITSLLGQGYGSINSAILAAYIHGLSGDIYAQRASQESLMASDIIAHLADAFRLLQHN